MQLQGGNKPSFGMLTGGYGTITIGIGIFGIKSKKCLKLSNHAIRSIMGEFNNNTITVGIKCCKIEQKFQFQKISEKL